MVLSAQLFLGGIALLVYSVEAVIENITKTALLTGVSAFLLAVFLTGMDFENWAFGGTAIIDGLSGVAIGSAFGSALFLVGVSVALAGVLVPCEPEIPTDYFVLMAVSPLIAFSFLLDGRLSRFDSVLLLAIFVGILGYLYRQESRDRETFRDEETEVARDALDGPSGEVQWTIPSQRKPNTSYHYNVSLPVIADGTVYVAVDDVLRAVAADTGTELWTYKAADKTPAIIPPARVGDVIYYVDAPNRVVALNAETGKRVGAYTVPFNGLGWAIVPATGALYVGGGDENKNAGLFKIGGWPL